MTHRTSIHTSRFGLGGRMTRFLCVSLFGCLLATSALGYEATYGNVWLTGMARVDWPLNKPGLDSVMVCKVKGPDGFIAIRSGPGTSYKVKRKLKRLAIVRIDTRHRVGHWIKVVTALRSHTPDGRPQRDKRLHVTGWAHDGYLCSFHD